MDPIQAILAGNWGAVTGWSLWIGTVVVVVTGSFREWWVPGARARRTEQLLDRASETIAQLTEQNGQLITTNEITKHFFEETTPRRKLPRILPESEGQEQGRAG